jgi:hypothetical protein
VRLLCPRHVAENTGASLDGFNSVHDKGILMIHCHAITVPYHNMTGLPVIMMAAGVSLFWSFLSSPFPVPVRQPDNLTTAQRAKLILHERCNHVNMTTLNSWIRNGCLLVDKSIANCPDPICQACQFGNAHNRPHIADKSIISADHLAPGKGVSADQLEAR